MGLLRKMRWMKSNLIIFFQKIKNISNRVLVFYIRNKVKNIHFGNNFERKKCRDYFCVKKNEV